MKSFTVWKIRLYVHPPLKMAGDLGGGGALVDHHIGVIPQGPQGVHPVEVLLMGAAVVGQHIGPPVAVASDGGMRHKAPEVLRQVLSGLSQAKCTALVRTLFSRAMLSGFVSRMSNPWVKSTSARLAASCSSSPSWSGAGQQVGVLQFDLVLATPKFRQVSDFDAPAPLLAADDAKSAVSRTAPAQKAVGRSQKPRIQM